MKSGQCKSDQSALYVQRREIIQPVTTLNKITTIIVVPQQKHLSDQQNKLSEKPT